MALYCNIQTLCLTKWMISFICDEPGRQSSLGPARRHPACGCTMYDVKHALSRSLSDHVITDRESRSCILCFYIKFYKLFFIYLSTETSIKRVYLSGFNFRVIPTMIIFYLHHRAVNIMAGDTNTIAGLRRYSIRVTIIAQAKKRTHKIFIKSGYKPVAGSYRATPMLSVLQIPYYNVNTLHQFCSHFNRLPNFVFNQLPTANCILIIFCWQDVTLMTYFAIFPLSVFSIANWSTLWSVNSAYFWTGCPDLFRLQ